MRHLSTFICIGFFAVLLAGYSSAQQVHLHPELGKTPPHKVLNKEVLSLPKREQAAWLYGAISGAFTALNARDETLAFCMLDYYQNGDGYDVLELVMKKNPDYPATSAVIAVANQVCDGLISQ